MQPISTEHLNLSNNEPTTHEIYDVSWREYKVKLLTLAINIYRSNWEPDVILSIGRGGLDVGNALSRLLQKTVGVVMCSSYNGEGERLRGELYIADHVSIVNQQLKGRGLLVDDLVDSGVTLGKTRDWAVKKYPGLTEMRTAVVFTKTNTAVMPDYSAESVDGEKWIFLPGEVFDRIKYFKDLPKDVLAKMDDESISKFARAMIENLPSDPLLPLSKEDQNEMAMKFAGQSKLSHETLPIDAMLSMAINQ